MEQKFNFKNGQNPLGSNFIIYSNPLLRLSNTVLKDLGIRIGLILNSKY